MAEDPKSTLLFQGTCPDCGERQVDLPAPLPEIGDDFDWQVRDFDSIRRFMLEELAARFPERTRWTAADMEVVLVEALASVLDQLSDMLDRVGAEAYLESARRPESVRRLLKLIGYDALGLAQRLGLPPFDHPPVPDDTRTPEELLGQYWLDHPTVMEEARQAGPRTIRTPRRMVTVADYAERLEEHPLVARAHAWNAWSGSWTTIHVAVVLWSNLPLDQPLPHTATQIEALAQLLGTTPERLAGRIARLQSKIHAFHREHALDDPDWGSHPILRTLLRHYLEAYRMVGQEVLLQDAVPVGISMDISLRVAPTYFQSEVRRAAARALGMGAEGFFAPGRLRFGEDLHAGDIFETLMALDGVEAVCLNRFKKVGRRHPDQADSGRISLEGLEIAVCDNDPRRPERGYFTLQLHGGRKG